MKWVYLTTSLAAAAEQWHGFDSSLFKINISHRDTLERERLVKIDSPLISCWKWEKWKMYSWEWSHFLVIKKWSSFHSDRLVVICQLMQGLGRQASKVSLGFHSIMSALNPRKYYYRTERGFIKKTARRNEPMSSHWHDNLLTKPSKLKRALNLGLSTIRVLFYLWIFYHFTSFPLSRAWSMSESAVVGEFISIYEDAPPRVHLILNQCSITALQFEETH